MENQGSKTKVLDPYAPFPFRKGGGDHLKFRSSAPFTPTYVTSNLSQSSDPMGMYNARVKNRQMLLENPARESRAKKEMDERRAARMKARERKKLGVIGKREAKQKGVWMFDERQAKWDLFVPLHHLWMGYMSELLALPPKPAQTPTAEGASKAMPNSSGMYPKLLKADFHGSIMTVCQSKNPSLIGLSGIVIHETENVFKVVTREDKLKVLPKQNSIFKFAVPLYSVLPVEHTSNTPFTIPPLVDLSASTSSPSETAASEDEKPKPKPKTVLDDVHIQFELYGNQFRFRAADRAGRKFKAKETIEL